MKTRYYALPAIFGLVASLLLPFQPPATLSDQGSDQAQPEDFNVMEIAPNLVGKAIGAGGNGGPAEGQAWDDGDSRYMVIDIEKNRGNGHFEYVDTATVAEDGTFSLSVTDTGLYRAKIIPVGYTDYAMTLSQQINVTNLDIVNNLGNVLVEAPDLRAVIRESGSDANVLGGELELYDANDRQLAWIQAWGPNNSYNVRFPDTGRFEIVVHPSRSTFSATAARSTYVVDVTELNGVRTVTYQGTAPSRTTEGLDILILGQANLSGLVLSPTGDVIREARVVPIDSEGQQLWREGVNTDEQGRWVMRLAPGTYSLVAEKPWNRAELGNSVDLGPIVVAENGTVTVPGGGNPLAINLSLRMPTWSGTVVAPGTSDPLAEVNVCFVPRNDTPQWICSYTGSDGRWGISAPAGFTGFDSTAALEIQPYGGGFFASKRYEGITELEGVLGSGPYTSATAFTNIALSPSVPNLRVQVIVPGEDTPDSLANIWVGLERMNEGWLGGANTDVDGVAVFSLIDPEDGFTVSVNIDHVPGLKGVYASTRTTFDNQDVRITGPVDGVYSVVVSLAVPNLFGIGVSPDSEAEGLRDLWIELFDPDTYDWLGGVVTDREGFFTMSVPAPSSGSKTYELIVNPPWNSADFARKTYTLTITSAGVITIFDGAVQVQPDDGLFFLAVGAPSVLGVVRDDSGNAVRDSWVTPMQDLGFGYFEYLWQSGSNTNRNGRFAMSLGDGDYLLEAEPSWNNSAGLSRSAKCQIRVQGGAVVTRSSCVDANGGVNLSLRGPNLKFTLVDRATTPQPVAFAHVGVGVGNWFGWAQSNRLGEVSIFIDEAEIAAANPNFAVGSTQKIRFWVDPPWGRSDTASEAIVRWECESGDTGIPLCGVAPSVTIGQAYPTTVLGTDVQFPGPNVSLSVIYPGGTAADEAWVSIFLEGTGGNREWLGGANANSAGLAAFNLPDSIISNSANKFAVEVNPGWRDRSGFSTKLYTNLTFAQVKDQTFALATPNLAITLFQPASTTPARWAWVGLERLDNSTLDPVEWLGGTGLDNRGKGALTLPANTKLKLLFFPGSGGGAVTECLIETNGSAVPVAITSGCAGGVFAAVAEAVPNTLTMTLSLGNYVGRVVDAIDNSIGIAGAIVFAERGGVIRQAVTDSNGNFGLQLDAGGDWTIKVFAVARPEDSFAWQSRVDTQTTTASTADDALVVPGGGAPNPVITLARQ